MKRSIKSEHGTTTDSPQPSLNMLKSILGAMDCSVTIRDRDFDIIYQNGFVTERFGDRTGEKCYKVLHGNEEICRDCPGKETFRDGNTHEITREQITASGETKFLNTIANPISNSRGEVVSCLEITRDVTIESQTEKRRQLIAGLADCISNSGSLSELIKMTTECIYNWTGMDAVGVRLQKGDDFPYFETRGFPSEFVLAENSLCSVDVKGELVRDSEGNPVIECMCGNVICGRFNPDLPFFTNRGSFASNCTTRLLASTSEEDRQSRTRDRCNGEGYESVALIPLGVGDTKFGLLQVNDKQKNRLPQYLIESLEEAAHHLSVGIERQLALDHLADAEERYRTIADFTYDWEMWESPDHKMEYVSPSCERITGYKPESFLENSGFITSLIYPEDIPAWEKHCQKVNRSMGLHEVQFRITTKDSQVIWIEHACQPVFNTNGIFVGHRSSSREITERKKLQEELSRQEKLESVGILAGGIAHDFNNLLGGVLGNVTLAMEDLDRGSEVWQTLREAEKATIRAANLTQRLLTFSKGGAPIKEEKVLREIIKESAEFVLSGSNVSARYHFPEDISLVEVDSGQFSQVIQNLTLNASQAMPDGGVLDIVLTSCSIPPGNDMGLPSGKYAKLTFQDYGEGISTEVQKKIFDPFYSTKPKGSGLGLATTHSIIVKHGGHTGVESTIGEGTTFTILLPTKADAKLIPKSPSRQASPNMPPLEGINSGRILVMDDEEIMRDLAAKLLVRVGYHVEVAKNTPEAVAMFKDAQASDHPFDLAILDLTIRGENGGKKTVRLLQELDPNIKAIVFSGYADDPVMANYELYGFCDKVTKPFHTQSLISAVEKALDGKK